MNNIKAYPNTNYVLLPSGQVARLLTPTFKHGKNHYNLQVEGKYVRISETRLTETFTQEVVRPEPTAEGSASA